MRSPEELSTFLRANGFKATPQRHAVFEALYREGDHPTAEVICARVREKMPTVSLRTVYQALNDLVELGEARVVSVGAGAALFDRNTQNHDHFVCESCHEIFDVVATVPQLVSSFPEVEANGAEPRLNVHASEVVFRGRCGPCET